MDLTAHLHLRSRLVEDAKTLPDFADVRKLKADFKEKGLAILNGSGGESGSGSFVVMDHDGDPVLIDQHV